MGYELIPLFALTWATLANWEDKDVWLFTLLAWTVALS